MTAATNGLNEQQRGLVFAGLGVWVLIVFRTIGRMNAGGLSARFLVTASLRAAVAMMLGYFAGASEYFKGLDVAGPTIYFLVGLAYPLFYESLIDSAYKYFKRNRPVLADLSLRMVDGIDEDTEDILVELNIDSVQHLATADPGVLTVRSLYPFGRIVDWIDQAILITYVRENIVILRALGIRGVIDFVSSLEPVVRNTMDRAEAEKMFVDMADKLKIPADSLYVLGLSIYYDYKVNLLMRLWQHNLQTDGYTVARVQEALTPTEPERIPIREDGQPSFSAFVNQRIDAELRREAAERAAKFREQSPDDRRPANDWLKTSYGEAFAAAAQRATIGANPKPGARTEDIYQQAFLKALG